MFPRFTQPGFTKQGQVSEAGSQYERETEKWSRFQRWYQTSLGQRIFIAEKRLLDKHLPDLFGYYLLQNGCPEARTSANSQRWLKSSRISTRLRLDYNSYPGINCCALPAQLPVQADSVDLVFLPHILEFTETPHKVLREAERILIADGHVVILGFNPYSLWNLVRWLAFWRKHESPWNASYLGASRVMDWLVLLGFEVMHRKGYFYSLPVQSQKVNRKLRFLEKLGRRLWPNAGAGYILVAKKRVEPLTPIRPKWASKRRVIGAGLETINRNKM